MLKNEEIKNISSSELSDYMYDEDIPECQKRLIAKELLERTHSDYLWLETELMYYAVEKLSMNDLVEVSKSGNPLTASIAYTEMQNRMTGTINSNYLSDSKARGEKKTKMKQKPKKRKYS